MSTSGECKLMSLGFHPPAISICISGPARTQNIERRRQQLLRRRAPAITIQIYTLRPLNSIAGADPLLFSLDYASCGPQHVTRHLDQDDPIVLASPVHLGGDCVDNSGRQPYRFIWRAAGVFLGSKAPGGAL